MCLQLLDNWQRSALHAGPALCLWLLGLTSAQAGALVYTNDFEGAVGPEWSSSATSVTPAGARRFLGEFSGQTVSLSLAGLPAHDALTLSFDLFVIRTWDGSSTKEFPPFGVLGPDIFRVAVAGGPTLLNATFSNISFPLPTAPAGRSQSFPDPFPGGDHPARTGAAEVDTLGYTFFFTSIGMTMPVDSVYRLTFTFDHTAASAVFNFSDGGLMGLTDESWGLDNVQVFARPAGGGVIPEPGALTLFGLGVVGLLGRYWHRKTSY